MKIKNEIKLFNCLNVNQKARHSSKPQLNFSNQLKQDKLELSTIAFGAKQKSRNDLQSKLAMLSTALFLEASLYGCANKTDKYEPSLDNRNNVEQVQQNSAYAESVDLQPEAPETLNIKPISTNKLNNSNGQIQVLNSGTSVNGKEIKTYLATNANTQGGKKILLIGTMHGLETKGKGIIDIIMQEHQKDEAIIGKNTVMIVPVLNPDSFKTARTNAHDVDLNRNFPTSNWGQNAKYNPGPSPASEPETQYVMKLMQEFKPDLVISLHTPQNIVYYMGDAKQLAEETGKLMHYPVAMEGTPGSMGTYAGEVGTKYLNIELPSSATTPQQAWSNLKDGFVHILSD